MSANNPETARDVKTRSAEAEVQRKRRADDVEFLAGQLAAAHLHTICHELCQGVKGARPDHPVLVRDVKNAALVAARSATFRRIVAQIAQLADRPELGDGR